MIHIYKNHVEIIVQENYYFVDIKKLMNDNIEKIKQCKYIIFINLFYDITFKINITENDDFLQLFYKEYNDNYLKKIYTKYYIILNNMLSVGNILDNLLVFDDNTKCIYVPPKNYNYFIYSDILHNYGINIKSNYFCLCQNCILSNETIKNIYFSKISTKYLDEITINEYHCNNCDNILKRENKYNYINKIYDILKIVDDCQKKNIEFSYFNQNYDNISNLSILIVLRNVYIRAISIYFNFMTKIFNFKKVAFVNTGCSDVLEECKKLYYFNDNFNSNISFYEFLLIILDIKNREYLYMDHHIDNQTKNLDILLKFCFYDVKFMLIDDNNNANNDVFEILKISRKKEMFVDVLCKEHINKNDTSKLNEYVFLAKINYRDLPSKNYVYFFNDEIYDLIDKIYHKDILFFEKNNIENSKIF